ncbi:helix-turn-helix transcriptional regulator [Moorena sp. SIO3E8]|uniref:helix-turn-helix domain-containing protein n=1 Tax=Moorena sp. SIO3E8 TaxID=2607830 RepID=UPI001418D146|nr:helix-turn-helix transcriptional regulator [Moorena sp. SIO3E8]NEO17852.1 helix-turn-helix transcriptional regulator [Moorena sp. SIO3E8]
MASEKDAHIGRRLLQARVSQGLSQDDLGSMVGVSFQQIQKYEKGLNRIGSGRLWDLSVALNVPIVYFFEGLADKGKTATSASELADTRVTHSMVEVARAFGAIEDSNVKSSFLRLLKATSGKV